MSETLKDRKAQIAYMIANKADYIKNGTSETEFYFRLLSLRQPADADNYKLFYFDWLKNHSISNPPSFTSWRTNYKNNK